MNKVDKETKNASIRVVLDVIAICIIGAPIVLFELHVVKPFKRGFFCDEPSIRYPLMPSTFNSLVALLISCGIPTAVISTVEYVHFHRSKQGLGERTEESIQFTLFGREVPPYAISLYKYLGGLFFACELGGLVIDVIKFSLGALRPHFIAVCLPDWSKINCSDAFGNHQYVTEYECTTDNDDDLLDARLTFPSGHANIAFAGFIYLCLYLQVRIQWKDSQLLKHTFQAVFISLAIFISAKRVSNYQHHMADVVAGGLIGTGSAVFVMMCITDLYILKPIHSLISSLQRDVENMTRNYVRMDSNTTIGTGFASESADLEDIVFTSI